MATPKGYYSLVQYCPDRSRLEAANVGVLLVCPELGYADVKLSTGHDRVRRFFRGTEINLQALEAAKRALANRVRKDPRCFLDDASLRHFIDTRANDITLTSLRPVRVTAPHESLAALYHDLVGGRSRRVVEKFPALDLALMRPELYGKIRERQSVTLPIINKQITAPYAFQNGSLNLIKPERFSESDNAATGAAMRLSIEGDLLNKHRIGDGTFAKLIVVADFHRAQPETKHRVMGLLDEYKVRTFELGRLDELVAEVRDTGH